MENKKIQSYKIEAVETLKKKIDKADNFLVTDYRGLTVEQITELRRTLSKESTSFNVVKNSFAKIAFSDMKVEGLDELFVGPTAIAFVEDEAGPSAKALFDLEKKSTLSIKGGVVEGKLLRREEAIAFSKLPTKIELLQMLMGTMNAPLQNFVYALNGVTTKLVRTVAAVAEKKGKEEE